MVRAMLRRSFVQLFVTLFALAVVAGCGGGGRDAKFADVKPGDMPSGGEWTGVYYSPVYGFLHLVQEGDTASGAWRTGAGDAWGEMSGKVNGNLFKYEWTEHKIGMVGPSATTKGRGYFKYSIPREDDPHEIAGEWGLESDEVGNTWKATKQINVRPDPKSVRPDEVEGRVEGGGWDDSQQPKPQEGGDEQESESEGGDLE
jgi:hypothetical protein